MIKILLSRKLGELRWTQADLARKTGIRPTTINEMYHELCERVIAICHMETFFALRLLGEYQRSRQHEDGVEDKHDST